VGLFGLLTQNKQGQDKREESKLQDKYPAQFPVERRTWDMFVVGFFWQLNSLNFHAFVLR